MFLFQAKKAAPILVVAAGLLSGCAGRDSVTVGAVPDDYRTRHPIVLKETEKTLDIPVRILSHRLSPQQKATVEAFLEDYGDSGPSVMTILVPEGSANSGAAKGVADDLAAFLQRRGVSKGYLQILPYDASGEVTAPIRLSYGKLSASVEPCGRWPDDMLNTYQNRNYANFGCSYQYNLAAQVANPMDFLGPRKQTTIDAENRTGVIERYRGVPEPQYKAGQVSDAVRENSEVFY